MRFTTTVLQHGKTATGLQVPDEVVESLDAGKRVPVTVTINGHAYPSTIAVMGGVFLVPLSAENRSAAGVAAGEQVDVDVELDTTPRAVTVPPDLLAALAASAPAKERFDGLSYSRQRAVVLSVESAKTDATRTRRIVKAVDELAAGRG